MIWDQSLLEEVIERMWPQVDPKIRPWAVRSSSHLSPVVEMYSAHHSHTRSCFSDAALRERVRNCWDCLDWVYDRIQLNLLCKLLRFWQASAEIYLSCCCPRQPSDVNSLPYQICHLPIWSALPVSSISPFPWYRGASVDQQSFW